MHMDNPKYNSLKYIKRWFMNNLPNQTMGFKECISEYYIQKCQIPLPKYNALASWPPVICTQHQSEKYELQDWMKNDLVNKFNKFRD